MDHHCPWLNNCIGHANHAHFIRFICSVSSGVLCCLTLIGLRMWDVIRYQNLLSQNIGFGPSNGQDIFLFYSPPPHFSELVVMSLNVAILFFLLFTVGLLSLWQLYYASKNMTTIESFEIDRLEKMKRKGQLSEEQVTFPFDLGLKENFCFMFGDSVWLWWLPKTATGNGLLWKTNKEFIEWPPREYYYLKKHPNANLHTKNKELTKKYGKHVRTGSEGYVVKELSLEERKELADPSSNKPLLEFSDFDSMDEETDEDLLHEGDRPLHTLQTNEFVNEQKDTKDSSSDEEVLSVRQRRINLEK
jgi:hypothetical protein